MTSANSSTRSCRRTWPRRIPTSPNWRPSSSSGPATATATNSSSASASSSTRSTPPAPLPSCVRILLARPGTQTAGPERGLWHTRAMGNDLFDLSGRVAVVTGGSRGLGREMALAFAEHGADVVIASRKLDACEAVAAEIRGARPTRARRRVPRRRMGRQRPARTRRCTPSSVAATSWSTTPGCRRCTRASMRSARRSTTR